MFCWVILEFSYKNMGLYGGSQELGSLGPDEVFSMMFQALMPYAERLDVQLQVGKVSGTKGLS